MHNFPHLTAFDPYAAYPDGQVVGNIHFFDWLLAAIVWVIGLGSPSQHTIDIVSVWLPAILGALTVVPVYYIGKELFGRWAGVLAAGLLALMPGEFLGQSILGFPNGAVLQTLLATVAVLFLLLAIKRAREGQWTFSYLGQKNWAVNIRPVAHIEFMCK